MAHTPDRLVANREFRLRLWVAAFCCLVICSLLVLRLVRLQVTDHQNFITQSENNRIRIKPVGAMRGKIFDRNGVLLATNEPSFTLELQPNQMADVEETLSNLDQLIELTPDELKRFKGLRKRVSRYATIPIKYGLNEKQLATIAANQTRLPGVLISDSSTRSYPQANITSHVVGYTGKISASDLERIDRKAYRGFSQIGKVGIERSYEAQLHGQQGFEQVETDASGRTLRVLKNDPAIPGNDIYLTIDSQLQRVAVDALNGRAGSVVALQPDTGEVLAMVSEPDYNPNLFTQGGDRSGLAALSSNPKRPLFNRSVQGQYPPGSTVKPLLAMAGLEYGAISPWQQYFCPGYKQFSPNSRKYRDWKRSGHKQTDMTKAIAESCDVFFYELALELGIDKVHDFLSQFGLGETSGLDIIGEKEGLLPSRGWKQAMYGEPWYRGETLNIGIGQGFMLATPLQLAVATASIANRGKRPKPRLVRALSDPIKDERQLTLPEEMPPIALSNPQNWQHTVQAMAEVLRSQQGSAHHITNGITYQAAGKTGTSQVFGLDQNSEYGEVPAEERLRDHALFIAFAPIEQPQIAIAVIVEHGGSGGKIAAPIARRVMDAWLVKPGKNGNTANLNADLLLSEDEKPAASQTPRETATANITSNALQEHNHAH